MKKFIALVLSLVMALSLCAPAWGAAMPAADASGVIELTADFELTEKFTVSSDVTIKATSPVTITTSVVDAIEVTGGTLTLGEGVTITSDVGAVFYANGGSIVINGAEVTADSEKYALAYLDDGGSITVNSGLLSHKGNDAHAIEVADSGCTATVTGGTVYSDEGSAIGITSTTGGTVDISGGTVSTGAAATYAAVYGYSGTISVSGDATITSANDSPALLASSNNCDAATVSITGGNIKSVGVQNDADADDVSITGGTFTAENAKDYVAEGTAFAKVNNTYIAGEEAIKAAATVGTTVDVLQGTVTLGDKTLGVDDDPYTVPTTYTVTFDANGGVNTLTQDPVPAGSFTLPTEHPFTREGYIFKGWATEANATEVLGATYDVTSDVTFYAIWEPVQTGDEGGDEGGNDDDPGSTPPTGNPVYPPFYGWGGTTTTEDKPVESPKTFDAGIALYVGVSVMGAIGTVVLGKKRED